jgi:hypothetical protein
METAKPPGGKGARVTNSGKRGAASIVIFGIIMVGQCGGGWAQVSSTRPEKWTACQSSSLGFPLRAWVGQTNGSGATEKELVDVEAVHVIAKVWGVSEEDLASVQVVPEPAWDGLSIYQVGKSDKAFRLLCAPIESYARARAEGHTKGFLLAAMTNKPPATVISDPDLRALLKARPTLPVHLLRKVDSGTKTNHAGEVSGRSSSFVMIDGKVQTNDVTYIQTQEEICRWVIYVLVDGEIAWRHVAQFKPDGSLGDITTWKQDAKDFDPKYRQVIEEVEKEVRAVMKQKGISGRYSGPYSWSLKQEKLKARGIQWRSPEELNPNARFD